jgi:hypothetical protein
MRRRGIICAAIAMELAFAACAPKADCTPAIEIEPYPVGRLCYASFQAEKRDAGRWSTDVEEACAVLTSDVKGPPRILWIDASDD